jgi:hypothetical protein
MRRLPNVRSGRDSAKPVVVLEGTLSCPGSQTGGRAVALRASGPKTPIQLGGITGVRNAVPRYFTNLLPVGALRARPSGNVSLGG